MWRASKTGESVSQSPFNNDAKGSFTMSETTATTTDTLENRVKGVLDEIRPMIQADGGDVEYVGLDADVVKVRLRGACAHCPGATMTLKMGIETRVKRVCPEIKSVIAV
jgi:Fe-S cluster biogenesis protein NfuA